MTGRNQAQGYAAMLITGGLICAVVAACIAQSPDTADSTAPTARASSAATSAAQTAAAPHPTTTAPAAPPATAAAGVPLGPGERVTVSHIVDGDSFVLTDGREVRVLGIDSCEMNTPGGREARVAALELQGGDVILRTEPGVDLDPYDRHLRYVQTMVNGQLGDYGEYMVQFDHTGVYQGRNDASAEYVQRLYGKDLVYAASPPSGRECGRPDPPPVDDSDTDVYVDTDDDDDGGESWFCRRKWYC